MVEIPNFQRDNYGTSGHASYVWANNINDNGNNNDGDNNNDNTRQLDVLPDLLEVREDHDYTVPKNQTCLVYMALDKIRCVSSEIRLEMVGNLNRHSEYPARKLSSNW
jgi:hypothetical protein